MTGDEPSKALVTLEAHKGFVLVYRGGWHDVYCDGENHLWTSGGFAAMPTEGPRHLKRRGKCDCSRWRVAGTEDKP